MVSSKLVIPCGACERALQEVVTVAIGRLAMFNRHPDRDGADAGEHHPARRAAVDVAAP